jgi:hypothetical protein
MSVTFTGDGDDEEEQEDLSFDLGMARRRLLTSGTTMSL